MSVVPEPSTAFDIERLLVAMRPRLHRYCARIAKVRDCRLVAGLVERHLAILVFDPGAPDKSPKYFVLLDSSAGNVTAIRDFRRERYVIDGADYWI